MSADTLGANPIKEAVVTKPSAKDVITVPPSEKSESLGSFGKEVTEEIKWEPHTNKQGEKVFNPKITRFIKKDFGENSRKPVHVAILSPNGDNHIGDIHILSGSHHFRIQPGLKPGLERVAERYVNDQEGTGGAFESQDLNAIRSSFRGGRTLDVKRLGEKLMRDEENITIIDDLILGLSVADPGVEVGKGLNDRNTGILMENRIKIQKVLASVFIQIPESNNRTSLLADVAKLMHN